MGMPGIRSKPDGWKSKYGTRADYARHASYDPTFTLFFVRATRKYFADNAFVPSWKGAGNVEQNPMRLPWVDCVFPGCDAASRWNIPSCKGKRPEDRKVKRIEDLKTMRKRIEDLIKDLRKALAASKQKRSSMESEAESLGANITDLVNTAKILPEPNDHSARLQKLLDECPQTNLTAYDVSKLPGSAHPPTMKVPLGYNLPTCKAKKTAGKYNYSVYDANQTKGCFHKRQGKLIEAPTCAAKV